MASAVLANRTTEPNWASSSQPQPNRAKYMGKLPSLSNPNPKFSSKKRQLLPPLPVLEIDGGGGLTQSAASDDASSISRRPKDFNLGGYVTFNVKSYTNKELVELKARLVSELERIRQLKNRIEASDLRPSKNLGPLSAPGKKGASNLSGNKRPFHPTGKRPSISPAERAGAMKKCGQILSKLMKHKYGYVFNTPVDVVGMQLHDYHDIIKCPMDLGAVKLKLAKNAYGSPNEFAADVRLTFENAMRYNPIGHEVYALAEQLRTRFEDLYKPIRQEESVEPDEEVEAEVEEEENRVREVEASSWDQRPGRDDGDFGRRKDMVVTELDLVGLSPIRNQNQSLDSIVDAGAVQLLPVRTPSPPIRAPASAVQLPVRTPSPPVRATPVKSLKQPKPKARDPNKREMSLEEKHKLGLGLQSLPPEKMEQVVGIIKKRNGHLTQDGDEIELDIEVVDTETLWELDRFVTNYKKAASKLKRQVLMGINNNVPADAAISDANKDMPVSERSEVVTEVKKAKKGDAGDEDVDIGDEMPMSSFPPVEIEKDNGHASSGSSSSGSSSDDSSSSSGSDSGSSSGSDSEDAHS